MIAKVVWTEKMEFDGCSESGHSVTFDAQAEHPNGMSSMEAVLVALCGCTSADVVFVLGKKREPLTGLVVSATAEQAIEPPRVFTHIKLVYRIRGNVSTKAVEDAVHLSKTKYCSVSQMFTRHS